MYQITWDGKMWAYCIHFPKWLNSEKNIWVISSNQEGKVPKWITEFNVISSPECFVTGLLCPITQSTVNKIPNVWSIPCTCLGCIQNLNSILLFFQSWPSLFLSFFFIPNRSVIDSFPWKNYNSQTLLI